MPLTAGGQNERLQFWKPLIFKKVSLLQNVPGPGKSETEEEEGEGDDLEVEVCVLDVEMQWYTKSADVQKEDCR